MASDVLGAVLPVVGFARLGELVACVDTAVGLGLGAVVLEERGEGLLDPFVVLARLGERHRSIALGALLAPDSGRPPSIVAKLLSGLDCTSDGRGFVAIGDLEGPPVPSPRDAEAAELVFRMVSADVTTMVGRYFQVYDAWNTPRRTTHPHRLAKVARALSAAQLAAERTAGVAPPRGLLVGARPAACGEPGPLLAELVGGTPVVHVVAAGDPPPAGRSKGAVLVRFGSLPDAQTLARECATSLPGSGLRSS